LERLISLLGLGCFVGVAYLTSIDRKAIQWRSVLWGIALQLVLALLILRTPLGFTLFEWLGDRVREFLAFSDAGAAFMFGDAFELAPVAFQVLPTVIFFSACISILYHYNILPRIIQAMAWLMVRTMGISGAESLSAAANIFVGPTEAPLVIKPYVSAMTLSELHAVMTGGFSTVAGGVLAAYIAFGIPPEHLIAASVMSAPAGLAMAKLLYPETETPATTGQVDLKVAVKSVNLVDAITTGTLDGLRLALNIGAMLIAFLGLLAAVNGLVGWLGTLVGLTDLTVETLLGPLLAPVAWLMGIPWADCYQVGILLAKKTILNEFVAYLDLQGLIQAAQDDPNVVALAPRTIVIATYALCGFSSFAVIGIQIGGIGSIAPDRQGDLARLGLRALWGGSLACLMTATIAGLLL
jgi:CNT family concentrative nucleoside transporter